MKSFFTAIGLLTILPVPSRWAMQVKTCAVYFPLVGFILGGFYFGLALGLSALEVSPDWIALSILIAMVVLTRAFHLDGIADMADGFWGGHTRERILAIMKDSATGTFGVIALTVILAIKYLALYHIVKENTLWMIVPPVVVSRLAMTVLAAPFSYARNEGTGHAVISNVSYIQAAVAAMYTAALLVWFFGRASVILIVIGIAAAVLVGLFSNRKIGGITGDVLGATSEITESLLLVALPFLKIHFFSIFWVPLSFT